MATIQNNLAKLKELKSVLEKAEALARTEVEAEEHYMTPVFRHLVEANRTAKARIDQIEAFMAEEKATADAKAKSEKQSAAKTDTTGKPESKEEAEKELFAKTVPELDEIFNGFNGIADEADKITLPANANKADKVAAILKLTGYSKTEGAK